MNISRAEHEFPWNNKICKFDLKDYIFKDHPFLAQVTCKGYAANPWRKKLNSHVNKT